MKMDLGFITETSLFRSAIKVDSLMALETSTSRIAAVDFGNMSSLIRLVSKKKDTVPAVSLRVVFSYDMKARSYDTARLFAYSQDAYRALCQLITEASQHSHYEPRIEVARLNQFLRDNADISAVVDNDFGYYDLINHPMFVSVNANCDLSHPIYDRFQPVYFYQVHALKKKDFSVVDCFPNPQGIDRSLYYENDAHYQKAKTVPNAIETYQFLLTRDFVSRPIEFKHKLPTYSEGDIDLFQALVRMGFQERYPKPTSQQVERLEYEISMILQMGFASYFLIVWDFIDWAKRQDIAVGPGRGSAAGSIVSYCLSITQLCPIEHGLYFERFLNPARISMPDIDVDFSQARRQEVIRYLETRYGEDRVSQIITFGKLKSKSAFKDACRLDGISAEDANKLTKLWPSSKFGIVPPLKEVETFDEIKKWISQHQSTWDKALEMEGFIRQEGVHPAGVIIAPGKTTDFSPMTCKDLVRACQYDKDDSEKFGLLKMDLLGLKNLDILQIACKLAKLEFYDLYKLPLNDDKIYERFREADTHGVFQFESKGMQDLLRKIQPSCFDDITAATALFRPGPLQGGLTTKYVKNKHSLLESKPLLPEFKVLLADTYETFVYQEQIMKIAQEVAGFTMSEADTLRKAIGKKDKVLMAKISKDFMSGSLAKGYNLNTMEELWESIEGFGDYCFNKSHSAAYSLISYYCMWFKVYYPREYALALLTADMGDSKTMAGHFFHFKKSVNFAYPAINEASTEYSIVGESVMIGLGSVKEIGDSTQFLQSFIGLPDFLERTDLDKSRLEQLIKAGYFDKIESDRQALLGNVSEMLAYSKNSKKSKKMLMFDMETTAPFKLNYSKRSKQPLISQETDAFGFNINEGFIVKNSKLINMFPENTVALTISKINRIKTKAKQEDMAIVTGFTTEGEMTFLLFPRQYKVFSQMLMEDRVYIIKYTVSPPKDQYEESYIINRCMEATNFKPEKLILVDVDTYSSKRIYDLPVLSTGDIAVYYEGDSFDKYKSKLVGYIDTINDVYLDALPNWVTPALVVFIDERSDSGYN